MKKLVSILFALLLSFSVSAQCSVTEAVDFTTTDCFGNEVHLFDILDNGQYVVINFFFLVGEACQNNEPKIVQAYESLGCNQHDVFFMEISNSDNNDALQYWCNGFGVEFPCIGVDGQGDQIALSYGANWMPTVILIAPDHNVLLQDIYPINSAQTLIDALAPYGIEQHDCNVAPEDPTVAISVDEVTSRTVTASFTMGETCASYYYLLGVQSEMESWMQMMSLSIEDLVKMWGINAENDTTYTWTGQTPGTEYTVYAVPVDADGTLYPAQTQIATTLTAGGSGVAIIYLQAEVLDESTVRMTATPNTEVAEYHYGLIEKSYYEAIGADSAVNIIRGDGYPLYEQDIWDWSNLVPNTDYYALGTGINANGEWGETAMIEFITSMTGVSENKVNTISIYPNPANDVVNIKADNMNKVVIYNAMGQIVKNMEVNGNKCSFSTANMVEGIYFVTIDNMQTKRFVVSH